MDEALALTVVNVFTVVVPVRLRVVSLMHAATPPEDTTYDAHHDAQNNDGQNNIADDITNKER